MGEAAGVHYASIDVLGCLMQPMHNYYDLVQEQLNKRSLLMSKPFLAKYVEVTAMRFALASRPPPPPPRPTERSRY